MSFLHYSGYQTADSAWIEGLLADSDSIVDVDGLNDGIYDWLYIATTSGICTIRRDSLGNSKRFGWLDQANITSIALAGGHIYFAHNNGVGDIGRANAYGVSAAMSDLFVVSNVTQANPGVVTISGGHTLANGDQVYFADVEGMTELNGNVYTVAGATGTTFELSGTDTTGYGAYTSGGDVVANVPGIYSANYGSTNSMFDAAAARGVIDICTRQIAGTWYLAYLFESEDSAYANEEPHYVGFGAAGGPYYITGTAGEAYGAEHISLANDGVLFITKGTSIAYRIDAPFISSANWNFDASAGNLDFDPSIHSLNNAWSKYRATNCSVDSISAGSNQLTLSATASSHGLSGIDHYGGMLTRSFDMRVTGGSGTDPSLDDTDEVCYRTLKYYIDANNYAYVEYQSYYSGVNGQTEYRCYGKIMKAGTPLTATVEFGTTAPTASAQLRIWRDTSQIYLYYNLGSAWNLLLDDTGATLSGSGYLQLSLMAANVSGESFDWNISEIVNTDQEDFYSGFSAGKPISGIDAYDQFGASGYSRAITCFGDDGAALLVASTDYIVSPSSVHTYGASGKDQNILSSNNVQAVMFDRGIGYKVWLATSDSGIDVITLFPSTLLGTANTTQGKTINNNVTCLAYVGSAVYGTSSGATTPGAGFLSGNFYATITDTDAYAHPAKDSQPNHMILTGCRKPTEQNYSHSFIYRRINNGTWEYFQDDGTWGSGGTKMEVTPGGSDFESFLAFQDCDLFDGKYEYKWSHVNSGDIESSGKITDPIYLDEPSITISYQDPSSVNYRAVRIEISSAVSGYDSGNESGKVHKIRVQQTNPASQNYFDYYVDEAGALPWTVMAYLEGGDGGKNVTVTPYDALDQPGASRTISFTYTSPDQSSSTSNKFGDAPYITRRISSDAYTLECIDTDNDFPAENAQTSILNEVWRADPVSTASGGEKSHDYVFKMDALSESKKFDLFYLANHNFNSKYIHSLQIYLCASDSQGIFASNRWTGSIPKWEDAEHIVELTALAGHEAIYHRPEWQNRYWALVARVTCRTNYEADVYMPYIGRFILIDSNGYWQPKSGVDHDFVIVDKDQSDLVESDDQSFEAAVKDLRSEYKLTFSHMTESDWNSARAIFREIRKCGDCLVVLKPSDILTGDNQPPTWQIENTWGPTYCQFAKEPSFRHGVMERATFTLDLKEIVGKGSGK